MTDIVEIFWDARPALTQLGLKIGGSTPLDPRIESLFNDVRKGASAIFPDCVTLVRITTRGKPASTPLRIVRKGIAVQDEVERTQSIIDQAITNISASADQHSLAS